MVEQGEVFELSSSKRFHNGDGVHWKRYKAASGSWKVYDLQMPCDESLPATKLLCRKQAGRSFRTPATARKLRASR